MAAVVPVRDGALPAGAAEAVAEAGGRAVLVGSGTAEAALLLRTAATEVRLLEAGEYAPARWAATLAPVVADHHVVILPGSPDGRDLAPRLAAVLDRPLLAGAILIEPGRVLLVRWGGRVCETHLPTAPFVATLEPGCRSVPEGSPAPAHSVTAPAPAGHGADPELLEVTPPDPASMDLIESPRIVGGGAGLGDARSFARLAAVAQRLDAAMGATRVVTDAGFVGHERQIGTTGVSVAPRLYLALGISGAVQHTGGLGHPERVIAVNLDASCPMMAMADLAIVADAPAVLEALAERLGVDTCG